MYKHTMAVGAAVVGLAVAGAATAQSNEYIKSVFEQLQRSIDMESTEGRSFHEAHVGSLTQGASQSRTIVRTGGRVYVRGFCDNDCKDLDLYVTRSPNNALVGSDVQVDDFPEVEFNANANTTYTVRANMYRCDVNPCYFAFGVYTE